MRSILIDLDGVVWESDRVVAGVPAAIDWLHAANIPHLFVTNTTSRPRRLIVDKLTKLGMAVAAEQILTPPIAATNWLEKNSSGPAALVVPAATREDFASIATVPLDETDAGTDEVAAIVIGDVGDAWTYPLLNKVFRLLMRSPPPQLIALGMTRYWRAKDGLRLDVAPFIKALEHAADCKAVVLGKPSPDFFTIALDMIHCTAADTVMIGDDIGTDVHGAQAAGLKGLLVKTGKFRPQDLAGPFRPDAILDSIAQLPQWWQEG
jgi:phospholysine phosphohistidine inorganic pyrophosphate phosphatase